MACILIRHKVTNFAKWKPMYDAHGTARETSRSKAGRVFRDADHSDETIILLDRSDPDSARRFIGSETLRQAKAKVDVADRPGPGVRDDGGHSDA
jgi:hypothetical protein